MFYNLKPILAPRATARISLPSSAPPSQEHCSGLAIFTLLFTEIAPGDSAAQCFPGPATNLNCDFTAINMGTVANNIDIDTCEDLLRTVNAQCGLIGGFGQPSDQEFQYSIDPNNEPDVCGPVDCGPGEKRPFLNPQLLHQLRPQVRIYLSDGKNRAIDLGVSWPQLI
ncbi:hypothetical protein B0H14DRAFT_2564499 [Mycena olivaceomarginata]|nr:hypothetical protein B0H14DRAFT_2564499 [Mycena olivaceomarginata]